MTEALCIRQTQDFGISVKISLQFGIFDQAVLGGRRAELGATAGHQFPAWYCHLEVGEQRENHACHRC